MSLIKELLAISESTEPAFKVGDRYAFARRFQKLSAHSVKSTDPDRKNWGVYDDEKKKFIDDERLSRAEARAKAIEMNKKSIKESKHPHISDEMVKKVFDALDNAVENGYGDELTRMSPEEIADDINRFDAELELIHPGRLISPIKEWKSKQKSVKETKEPSKDWELTAEPHYGGKSKHIGFFVGPGSAKQHVDKMDDKGEWDQSCSAVLTNKKTGKTLVYGEVDGRNRGRWEEI